jgi:phage gp45-like
VTDEEKLRATVESIVARNRDGRQSFFDQSSQLQRILLNGTDEQLDQFIDRLADFGDEVRGASGEDIPVGEAGSG